jgi:hypothetical protein
LTGPRAASGRRALDRFDAAALAALALLSVAVLAGLLLRVWTKGGLVTGSDGYLVVDQLQYLNWLRQAGDHVLVGNLYDLAPGPRDFLHPGVLISGLLHRLGLGLAASYLAWKPVAVVALFAGARLYVRRFLNRTDDRRLALVVALFAASPVAALVGWSGIGNAHQRFQFDFLGNEMWPGNYLWGYLFTAVAVALVPLGLLAYERGRSDGRRAMLACAAGAGLIASWFQPWQGATFALILVASELIASARERHSSVRTLRTLVPPLAATAAPLVYYLVLSKRDSSWALADRANDFPRWPWWITVAVLAPLAIPALFAYAQPARDFGSVALRAWPVATLLVFYQPAGTFPFHAFQGLALPLTVLAVVAVRARLGDRSLPVVGALACATILIVPGTAYQVDQVHSAINKGLQAHFLTRGEHDALVYLDRLHEPGGVLAPAYSGTLVPAYTGRETWVGAGSWSPSFGLRNEYADRLFAGRLSQSQAQALVRLSGARFLLSDCHGRADINRLVAGFTDPPRRFGCATVYRVRPPFDRRPPRPAA